MEAHRFFFETTAPAQDKPRLFSELRAFGIVERWSPAVANEIELILEEWWTNLLNYAFPAQPAPFVSVQIISTEHNAEMEIQDNGVAFNPAARPDPDLNCPIEQRPIGGLGIYMMKKLSASMECMRSGGHNVVRIRKDLLHPVLRASES